MAPPDKVDCLDAELSTSYFGLSTSDYIKLLSKVTDVIHNACPVDFNLSMDSFTNPVGVVRQLVDFSAYSFFDVQFFFVSSVVVVGNWGEVAGRPDIILEKIYDDWRIPTEYGVWEVQVRGRAAIRHGSKISRPFYCHTPRWPDRRPDDDIRYVAVTGMALIASTKYVGKLPTLQMATID